MLMLNNASIPTPAFVYDENEIVKKINTIRQNVEQAKILFPLKPFTIIDALRLMAPMVQGFSASSLFEARLARDVLGEDKLVHVTAPGLRFDELTNFSKVCDCIYFNSLSQLYRYRDGLGTGVKLGLRVNPHLSFVKDTRYDPCRKHSKLGVSIDLLHNDQSLLAGISGIQFHTNCESTDFYQLMATVQHIDDRLPGILNKISWINLGGGYLFEEPHDLETLSKTVDFLKNNYGLDVIIEPGKGIVGNAGYIISSVIDQFESDGRTVAILDTTVNHMPEVFEYQYTPEISSESDNGKYEYILAGASCLAGDLFGEYRFDERLDVGSKIIFENMGAYTLVKASMFNGINLPSIYAYTTDGKFELKKKFNYNDLLSRCGGPSNVVK